MSTAADSRAVFSLAGEAWAYLDALHRSASSAARALLTLFQTDFNTYRSSIVAVAGDPAAMDQQLPRSLAIDGIYGPNSRKALAYTLASADRRLVSAVSSMPNYAGQLGRWFWDRLVVIFPPNTTDNVGAMLWSAAGQARGRNNAGIESMVVGAWAQAQRAGLEEQSTEAAVTSTGNQQMLDIIMGSLQPILGPDGGSGGTEPFAEPTPIPTPATPAPGSTHSFTPSTECVTSDRYIAQGKDDQGRCVFLDTNTGELVVFGASAGADYAPQRGGTDPYLIPAIVAGLVVLGGAAGYQIWRKRGIRR